MFDTMFPKVMKAFTTKKTQKILQYEFQCSDKVRQIKLQTLRTDFENLKMKNSKIMEEYSSRISYVVN